MRNPIILGKNIVKRTVYGPDFHKKLKILKLLEQNQLIPFLNEPAGIEILNSLGKIDLKNPQEVEFVKMILTLLSSSMNSAVELLVSRYFENGTLNLQKQISSSVAGINSGIEKQLLLAAKQLNTKEINAELSLQDVEFRVYSQWGQDGIIQFLLKYIPIPEKKFVEFGVEDYQEATTKFLLLNNNWSGLIMDGSAENMSKVSGQDYYWQHDLIAKQAFITKENINGLLLENKFKGDIGLLVVDIDGNDYWVWKEIAVIKPRIVFCEYNSVLGNEHQVSIPYQADFTRLAGHYSGLYFGVSLPALKKLALAKGYEFFSCNSAGNDAIFIRKDLLGYLPKINTLDYVVSRFRESRDQDGKTNFLPKSKQLKEIKEKEVVNLENNKVLKIKDLYGLK